MDNDIILTPFLLTYLPSQRIIGVKLYIMLRCLADFGVRFAVAILIVSSAHVGSVRFKAVLIALAGIILLISGLCRQKSILAVYGNLFVWSAIAYTTMCGYGNLAAIAGFSALVGYSGWIFENLRQTEKINENSQIILGCLLMLSACALILFSATVYTAVFTIGLLIINLYFL